MPRFIRPTFRELVMSLLFTGLLVVVITGCASASEIKEVRPDSLVVDVRTTSEFKSWHYPGAINIPVTSLPRRLKDLGDKNRPIIVYCRSGNRSTTAKKILMDNGFTDVKNGGGVSDMRALIKK